MDTCRVCVVDDDAETASVLCEGLTLNQYHACAASTGLEGLRECEAGRVDLVLLDVCLPDLDGYEVCRRLKSNPKTSDIVVIFVTVKGGKEDIELGYKLGAADYITKPYNLPMVMVRVDAAMRAARAHDAVVGAPKNTLADAAYTDELTGLRNMRYLMERLQEEVEKAHRYSYPVSCVVIDIDEIKPQDEDLGAVSLDDLLAEVAMALRSYSRNHDVLARYDGTMFAAVLPHTPLDQARGYASKIMREVDSTTFSDPSFPTNIRLSMGIVACRNGSARGGDFVLGEAMRALLRAKSRPEERLVACDLS